MKSCMVSNSVVFSFNSEMKRPERLMSRLKSEDVGPKMVTLRQPKGPDGTKGFSQPRQKRMISET